VITWKDFVLDGDKGPLLNVPGWKEGFQPATVRVSPYGQDCREKRLGGGASVMDDAKQIQETGQEQRLARMAGLSDSESKTGMEAGRADHQADSTAYGGRKLAAKGGA
jgi:hypothetical protein